MPRFQKLLDTSPRQLYTFLQRKAAARASMATFNEEKPCVFVLSTGRVGTETVAALFQQADNLFAYHEPTPKLYGLSKLAYQHSLETSAHSILTEAFSVARAERLGYALTCGKGYLETSPQVTFLAPMIVETVNYVKFIFISRDPRDVVRSAMRRKWYSGNIADQTRIEPLLASSSATWQSYSPFQKNLWLWAETNRWISEFCKQLPREQTLYLKAEDLFSKDAATVERLFRFVNVSIPTNKRIDYVLGKQLNRQTKNDFPKAEAWSDEMRRELIALTGDVAHTLGYTLQEPAQ